MNMRVMKEQLELMRSEARRHNRLAIGKDAALEFLDTFEILAEAAVERDYLKMKVDNAEKVGVSWTHIYDGEEACRYPGAEEHGEQLSALRAERDEWKRMYCEAKQLLDRTIAIAESRA